jgi:hypothetical protein
MMNLRHILLIASAAITVALGAQVFAQKTTYYKYINKKGINVVSSRIPSEYVKRGYSIVTFDGRVIETIPPELSPAEKARLIIETERLEKLKEWDTLLLRRYSHPDDVEAAKQRKLTQNESGIILIDLNIEKINSQIDLYQSLAAEDERAGKVISAATMTSINKLKSDRELERSQRQQKIDESNKIIEEHDKDIERLKIIRSKQP